MVSKHIGLGVDATQADVEQAVRDLANDPDVHGLLVQLPPPEGLAAEPAPFLSCTYVAPPRPPAPPPLPPWPALAPLAACAPPCSADSADEQAVSTLEHGPRSPSTNDTRPAAADTWSHGTAYTELRAAGGARAALRLRRRGVRGRRVPGRAVLWRVAGGPRGDADVARGVRVLGGGRRGRGLSQVVDDDGAALRLDAARARRAGPLAQGRKG